MFYFNRIFLNIVLQAHIWDSCLLMQAFKILIFFPSKKLLQIVNKHFYKLNWV